MARDLSGSGAPSGTPALEAHSVAEVQQGLSRLWAAAVAERMESERAVAAALASQRESAARAAAALAAADESGDFEGHHVAARSSVLNLVVIAGDPATAERCAQVIAGTAGRHPSRSLIISEGDEGAEPGFDARIAVMPGVQGATESGTESIMITTRGETRRHLASIINPLLVHDLPVAMWWPGDPPLGGHRADRLLPLANRLIVDGSTWAGDGLDLLSRLALLAEGRQVDIADFALMRQARWREALASVYDLPDLRPHLGAVRSINITYSGVDPGDPEWRTNIVRPLYHVAWLASRLGMTVTTPLRKVAGGRTAELRQKEHPVAVAMRATAGQLRPGSTLRVQIESRHRGVELVGDVTAGDRTVSVAITENGRERVKRTYSATRLTDADLLMRAVEELTPDPLALDTLRMARRIVGADRMQSSAASIREPTR